MSELDAPLVSLYRWVLHTEEQLSHYYSSIPPVLRIDHDRLQMSLHCLRVSLEIRLDGLAATPLRAYPPLPQSAPPSPDLPC